MPILNAPPSFSTNGTHFSSGATRRIYDLLANVYPLSTMLFHSVAHKAAINRAGIRNGMAVLEVATGSGEMLRRIVRVNPDGVTCGIDLSPNMAARTQKLARRISGGTKAGATKAHCQAVDARRMPFRDASFDAVVCCYLLELLPDDDILLMLDEIRRILRPGGRFSLVTIGQNVPAFNAAYRVAGQLVPAFWGRQVASAVGEALQVADFSIVHDEHVQQGFYPSRVIVARR
jgi:ubiquinone/menaquinone biosynthesis C-methylase UbiE